MSLNSNISLLSTSSTYSTSLILSKSVEFPEAMSVLLDKANIVLSNLPVLNAMDKSELTVLSIKNNPNSFLCL